LRSKAIVFVLALSTALAMLAATPAAKKKTGSKKTSTKASTAKTSGKASNAKASKSKGKKTTAKQTAASRYRRSTQREPAPERYKEIQQSLADKGYYGGPVTGTWGPDSVAALKHFQRDQNIGDDGKLGSLSLMALGLGPKRETTSSGAPPP
jgi:peptidoglycan hydrolase-like protein with peptidoglycan-binding domain